MEGYSYPIIVEGPWPSTPTRTISTKLQIYFQSKKKSQGGDCVVNFSEQTSAATVKFKSAEIRDQVLAKGDHSVTIDNQVVKLKVFKPGDGKCQTEEPGGAATTGSDMAMTQKILQTMEDGSSRSRLSQKQSPFNKTLQRNQDVASARPTHLTTESRTGQASIDCQTPGHVTRGRTTQRKGKLHADPLHGEDGRPSQGPASSANPNAWVNGGPPPRPDQPARRGFKGRDGLELAHQLHHIIHFIPMYVGLSTPNALVLDIGLDIGLYHSVPVMPPCFPVLSPAGLDKSHSNPATEQSLRERSGDSSRSGAVVLEDLPDNFSKDVLVLLVENIGGVSEEEYFLEMISGLNVAVVTFNDPYVAEKFLTESTTNKKFQQHSITSRPLENTRSIKVESLPAQGSTDLLELYFEKWGGAVEKITMIPEEQAAIVTLQQQQDVDRILGKDHHIGRTPVTIYPYVMSLGTALYGKDRPEWKLPKPFTKKIHPAIREFLRKKDLISSILKQMESVFCQVNMDKAEVQLSPLPTLLKQKKITKKDIDSWRQNSTDEFRDILSSYDVFEHAVIPSIWSTVEKDIRSVVKDKAFMSMDNGVLTLAGMAQDIKLLKPILENVLRKASDQMNRDKNSVSDSTEMSSSMYSLFLQEGLQSTATGKYPELKLTYRNDTNQLTLRGLPLEIIDIKNWILERKLSMKQKPLKMDPFLLEFLKSVNCEEMSECLFTSKGICAVYRVENRDVVLTGSTDRALTEAEERLQMTLTSSTLSLEDLGVLKKPEWRSLSDELCDTYNSAKKKTIVIIHPKHGDGLIVTGFRDPVSEVSRSLEKFINAHSNIKEVIRVRSYAMVKFILEKKSEVWQNLVKNNEVKVHFDPKIPLIRLSGERVHVQPAMETLQKISDALLTDKLPIKKAGAKKYFQEQGSMFFVMIKDRNFVIALEESHVLDEDEDNFEENRVEDFGQLSCEFQVPGGIIITVRKADICQFKVDAVVSPTNEDLKHIGGVALALLKAAGPSLQEWSDKYVSVNGRVPPGQAVTTQAGRLPCKFVVHAVGPCFTDTDKSTAVKRLRQVVRESLNQAERNNCSSIAVPAISSRIFGFPLELCTETIAKELHAYVEDQKFQSGMNMLKQIHLVDNDANTVNAMAQAVRKEFAAYNPRMTFPQHGSGRHGRGDEGQEYYGQGKLGKGHQNVEKEFETQGEMNPGQLPRTRHGDTGSSVSLETQSTPEGLRISLKKGNIQDACSDVIVNTILQNMDLSQGAVSKALLQAAGPQLQSEARSRSSNLSYGDLVVTDGYNLNCKKVFHTVCPFWNGGANSEDEQALKKIFRNCLIEAEQQNMFSISFPAIGTGNLGFPKDVVSSTLLREIHDFSSRDRPWCLKEVTVIVQPSDKETVQSFRNSFRGERPGPNTKREHAIHQQSHQQESPAIRPSQSSGLFGVVSTPTLGVHTVQVGHVTLKVSSGDITKERCDAIVNSSNQSFSLRSVSSQCLQQKEMIMTSGGQLPSRYIIHIIGRTNRADIKDAVYSVLKLCEEQKFSSVAFPALGTGQGGVNPTTVADAMIDAVIDFVKKKKGPLLQSVKFLIFQTSMVSDFHQIMLRKQQEGVEDTGMFDRIKDKFFNFIWGSGPEPEDFVMVGEEFEPAVFQLCAETRQDLNEARELISSFIVKEQASSSIRDSAINRFTREDAETLTNLQRELTVSIQLNKTGSQPIITVEGLTRDVVKAESTIRDMIRKVEKNETRKREAFMLSSMVEWQYLDSRNQMVPFDIYTNFDLEEAFAKKQPRIKIDFSNEQYEVDLTRNMATGRNRMIELKRVDQRDVRSEPLPSHWEDMKGSFVKRVPVKPGSQEYTDVENEFRKTGLNNQILNIERVQSETLWRSYMIQKKHLDEKNKHKNNERKLFHGTSSENIDKIDDRGFNRSYAGMHGAAYGNGAYFAVDPSYSDRGYAKPDRLGHKWMYLARVLVGDYTTGKAGLLSPPAKSSTATDLYDSVTDNQHNPTMFVIFHDVQAYPEYLITFQ
ncbi:hypothetical protein NFI96_031569 [Prochilodus magdalenae]|nr:hypothetical protein NFI96_031569 [Prochilodus magdalenae]